MPTCIRYNNLRECSDYWEYMENERPQIFPCDRCKYNLSGLRPL